MDHKTPAPPQLRGYAADLDIRNLAIDAIELDQNAVHARSVVNEKDVRDCLSRLQAGECLPLPVVFWDGKTYRLADGFSRVKAYRDAGPREIEVDVRLGGRPQARLYAIRANAANGRRFTNEEKRKAVMSVITQPEWVKCSDREIARITGFCAPFVAKMREALRETLGDKPPTGENVYIHDDQPASGRRKQEAPNFRGGAMADALTDAFKGKGISPPATNRGCSNRNAAGRKTRSKRAPNIDTAALPSDRARVFIERLEDAQTESGDVEEFASDLINASDDMLFTRFAHLLPWVADILEAYERARREYDDRSDRSGETSNVR